MLRDRTGIVTQRSVSLRRWSSISGPEGGDEPIHPIRSSKPYKQHVYEACGEADGAWRDPAARTWASDERG